MRLPREYVGKITTATDRLSAITDILLFLSVHTDRFDEAREMASVLMCDTDEIFSELCKIMEEIAPEECYFGVASHSPAILGFYRLSGRK
jgi:hypothetical protein